MTAEKIPWTAEQYQLAQNIIDTYRHPLNKRLTDWQRAFGDHPEWQAQLQGGRSEKAYKAFLARALHKSQKAQRAPARITRNPARAALPAREKKAPGVNTHGQAPYPEYTSAGTKIAEPFNCAAFHALLPSEDKKRITNCISAWAAIGWLKRVSHGTYKRTAQFGTPVHGVETARRERAEAAKHKRLAKHIANGMEAPAPAPAAAMAPPSDSPPPVPLNFCPSCGFNLMMLKAAFTVAAKHSRRQNGA